MKDGWTPSKSAINTQRSYERCDPKAVLLLCLCTQQPLAPPQDHCSESADICLDPFQKVKDHLLAQRAPAAARLLFNTVSKMFKDTTTVFSIDNSCYNDNLKSCAKCIVLRLHLLPMSFHFLSLIKTRGLHAYLCSTPIKALFEIKSACPACVSAAITSPASLSSLSSRSRLRPTNRCYSRNRFHINDCWLLTPNALSDQCRITLRCKTHLSGMGQMLESGVFSQKGNP